ncbi:methylthioribulose 1-phosphate dehydratase [Streptomyces meridianus]|uniref:Methylthioribulose 1-phosphate dehydratase n=1 Tax=Streptomyces meridianus TaxID=2938945 RepID=A0ABT0XCE4_9ACTN|nr:methylthioribulose 1-phosphate dehydratase [Streptomyces meridianus]MCM2579603.1 methylthioribulose 1-phosphate dehydratase [Streptomyces meridianus]
MKPVKLEPSVEVHRGLIAATCRELYRRGWMEGTAGNVSTRSGEAVVISASGCSKGQMSRQDTVIVDGDSGLPLVGEVEWPSAETAIHLAIYQNIPDSGAVVHTHSPHATALASLTAEANTLGYARFEELELAKGLGVEDPNDVRVPVFPNWFEVQRIADEVSTYLKTQSTQPPVLLIARHGVTTWGRDLEQARNRMECIEALCHQLILTSAHTVQKMEDLR